MAVVFLHMESEIFLLLWKCFRCRKEFIYFVFCIAHHTSSVISVTFLFFSMTFHLSSSLFWPCTKLMNLPIILLQLQSLQSEQIAKKLDPLSNRLLGYVGRQAAFRLKFKIVLIRQKF